MSKSKVLIIAALTLGVTSGINAQQQTPAPPQLPQAPNMTFFVTGAGPGKGADLGGLEGADAHCQTLAARHGAGGKTWRAYLSTQEAARQAGGQCARPDRQRPVAELQGHGRRDQRRRSAQRQQQAQLRQLAERARLHHSRCRLRAEPARRADGLDTGRPGVPGRRGSHLQELDEQHPGRRHARPYRPQGSARRCAGAVVEFVASVARARRAAAARAICAAPAATDCSTASPRSKAALTCCESGPGSEGPAPFVFGRRQGRVRVKDSMLGRTPRRTGLRSTASADALAVID